MIDNVKTFNIESEKYAQYRPRYPKDFYNFLMKQVHQKNRLWDCACGNGQVSVDLVDEFNQVFATDINENQLANAFQHPKISYAPVPAEKTGFPDNYFDLICVAQALHWFDMDTFFKEADRVLKSKGILAIFGYGFFYVNGQIDRLLNNNLHEIIKDYWSDRNLLVINHFRGVSFPFKKINSPEFEINLSWKLKDMISYISTWSAVKKYNIKHNDKIENRIYNLLKNKWTDYKPVKMKLFSFIRKK